MGNQVCTDHKPFSIDDIRKTKQDFPGRNAVNEQSPLILKSTLNAFEPFEHNIKAFSFKMGGSGGQYQDNQTSQHDRSSGGKLTVASVVKRSNVCCHAVPLREKVVVDPTSAYLVVHIKRTDTKQLLIKHSADVSTVPAWAAESFAAFTPRGLGNPFGIDIAAVRWRSRNSEERYKFEYSLHVYNGRSAHQLVVAVATMQAFQLEKHLLNDTELLQRLFYGFNASRPSELSLPSAIAGLDFSDQRINMSHRSHGTLNTVFQHHALMRNLYNIDLDLAPTPAAATTPRGGSVSMPAGGSGLVSNHVKVQSPRPDATSHDSEEVKGALAAGGEEGNHSPTVAKPLPLGSPGSGTKLKGLNLGTVIASTDPDDGDRGALPAVNRRSPVPISSQPPKLNLVGIKSSKLLVAGSPPLEGITNASGSSTDSSGSVAMVKDPQAQRNSAAQEGLQHGDDGVEEDEVEETRKKIQKLREQAPIATEVLPYLFVGGEEAAKDRKQLLEKGITHVVNAAAHAIKNFHDDVFEYTTLFLCDSPDEPIFSLFPLINRVIEEAKDGGGKTFIHCHQGVSRSCSLVIAYVMWKQGLCYDLAYSFVRDRRKVCSPNSGFYVNLLRWERQLVSAPVNCCWSFMPFSKEHLFPYVFREQGQTPQEVAQLLPFVLDPRLVYALLSPLSGGADSDVAPSQAVDVSGARVYFLRGKECSDDYASAAFAALEAHLKYNFYIGLTKTTKNANGGDVTYHSTTLFRRRVENLDPSNPQVRAIASSSIDSHPVVHLQRDPNLDGLLQNDLPLLFTEHLSEVMRAEGNASDRKRRREEILGGREDVQAAPPFSLKFAPPPPLVQRIAAPFQAWAAEHPAVAPPPAGDSNLATGGGWDEAEIEEDPAPPSRRRGDNDEVETNNGGGDDRLLRPARQDEEMLFATSGDDSEPEEGVDSVIVFEYPFVASAPLDDVISIEDLATDKGYAIVVRGYRGAGVTRANRRPHVTYLWLGEEFTKDEVTIQEAFHLSTRSSSGALTEFKITNKTRLSDISEEEIVYERDEPSELLLAFA